MRRAASIRKPLLYLAVLAVAYAVSYNGDVNGNLDFYHEGERLAHLDAILDGKMPFRDVYVPHGLGENIVKPIVASALFGKSVESLRRLGENSFIYRGYLPPLGLLATLLAAAALLRRPGPLVAVALALLTCFYEISDRQIFGFLAVAGIGMFIHSRRSWWLLLAGVCGALAALYSLEVGIYVAGAGLAWILLDARQRRRSRRSFIGELLHRGLYFVAGLVIGFAPLLVWCQIHGILRDFGGNVWIQLFMRHQTFPTKYPGLTWNSEMPLAGNLLVSAMFLLLYYGIPGFYAIALVRVFVWRGRLRRRDQSRIALASLLGLAFWVTVVGRPDLWHVAYAFGPFVLFAAVCADANRRIVPGRIAQVSVLAALAAIVLTSIVIGQGGAMGRQLWHQESTLLPDYLQQNGKKLVVCRGARLGEIAMEQAQADFTVAMVSYIDQHTTPDDTILDLSGHGLLYFLSERRSPTRFHELSRGGNAALAAELVKEVLARDCLPRYIIRSTTNPDLPAELDQLIKTYYAAETRIGYLEFFRCEDVRGHHHRP
jgi:hypothetical protein